MTEFSFLAELLSIKQPFTACACVPLAFSPKACLLKVPFFFPAAHKDIVQHRFRVICSTLGPLGNRNGAL